MWSFSGRPDLTFKVRLIHYKYTFLHYDDICTYGCDLYTSASYSHTSHSDWRDQPASTLEIWLDQKPVYHRCSAENRSLSTSGQLPSPYWTTTVSSVPTLWWRRRDGAASSTLLPVTRAGAIINQLHQFNRPSTHVVLSGVDRGRDTPPPDRE